MRKLLVLFFLAPVFVFAQTKEITLEDIYKKGTFRGEFISAVFDNTKKGLNKLKINDKLWFDGSNLSNILEKILKDENKRETLFGQIDTYIPGFSKLEIKTTGSDETLKINIFERGLDKPIESRFLYRQDYSRAL